MFDTLSDTKDTVVAAAQMSGADARSRAKSQKKGSEPATDEAQCRKAPATVRRGLSQCKLILCIQIRTRLRCKAEDVSGLDWRVQHRCLKSEQGKPSSQTHQLEEDRQLNKPPYIFDSLPCSLICKNCKNFNCT